MVKRHKLRREKRRDGDDDDDSEDKPRVLSPLTAAKKLSKSLTHLDMEKEIPHKYRSKLGSGAIIMKAIVDGRTHRARRFKEFIQEMANDLGGMEYLTVIKKGAMFRCAALLVISEELEQRWLARERPKSRKQALRRLDEDLKFMEMHSLTVRTFMNLAAKLGFERQARLVPDTKPQKNKPPETLEGYVADKYN